MATGTGDIAKIWDLYTSINNSGDLDNAKTSLSKKYGTFTNSAAPSSGWGTGLCPSKTEWINLNSAMKKGDINIAGTYSNDQLVKYSDISYILRAATLTLSASSYAAPVAGGSTSITVTFTNSDSYSVSSNQSWCTYTVNSNASGGTTTITAAANGTTSYRTATVTFSCTGRDGITISKTVTVTQYGKTTLSVNPTSLSFTPAGGKNTSTATPANLSTYSVVSGDTSWCTVSKSSNTISVSATVNPSSARSTTVYVHGKGDYDGKNVTATIAVSQSSGISSISLSSNATYDPAAQSNKTASVSRTNLTTYYATSSQSWCTVPTTALDASSFTYNVAKNTTGNRSAVITVYGTGTYDKNKRTSTITISQNSGIPTISLNPNTDWSMTSNAAATRNVTVSYTNASAYSVTASASWVTVSKSGNTVTLSVAKNTGGDRSTTVRFGVTGTYTGTFVYDDIIVNQEGVSNLTVSPTSWTVPLDGGSTTVSGSPTNLSTYYVTSSVDWAKATKSGNTITISATSAIGAARNGTITLYGTGDSDKTYRTATVSISQAAGSSSISLSSNATYTPDAQSNKTASVGRTNISTYGVTRGSDSWITVSKSGDTVTYSLEKNTSSARTGTITVYGTGTYDKTQRTASIKVSQSIGSSSINIEANANYTPAAQNNKTATVTKTNVDSYTVSSDQIWCTVPSGNQTAGSISYSLVANSSGARTATITVKGTGKYTGTEVSDSIKVSQSNGTPNISTNPTSLSFTKDGGSQNATVTLTNVNSDYTVSSNQTSWCTVTKSGTTITVTCARTNSASTRTATITVAGTGTYGGSDSCTISISQSGAPSTFTVSPTTWSMTSNAAANKSFTVTSSNMGAFNVGNLAVWLSVSATATNSFTLTAAKNNDGDRSDVIYVSAVNSYTGVGSTASITISQEGKSSLTVSPLTHTISPAAQSVTSNVTATNMSVWYVAATSTGGWLTATKGTSNVTINAGKNTSTSRSGKVFVYGTGASDGVSATATITVTQNSGSSSINIEANANYSPAAQSNKTATVTKTNVDRYTVSSNQIWCTVPAGEQTAGSISYSLTTNGSYARTATITVYATGTYTNTSVSDYIYVSQSEGISSISSSSSANYSAAAQNNKTAYVSKTNIDTYYATSSQSWCTVPTSAMNGTSFSYSLTKNTGAARGATVTIYGTGTYDNVRRRAYIYISQNSGAASVTTTDWSWNPTADGGSTTKTVTTSNVGSLIVSSNDSTSWASASISGNNVTLYAAKNTGGARTATIYVGATGTYDISFKSDYFKIGQASGASSISISSNANYGAAAQSNKTASVSRTNISTYGVTRGSATWVTVTSSGDTVTYSLSANSSSARTATITVYGTGTYDNTKRTASIKVGQNAGTPSISLSKTSIYLAGATATNTDITVTHPNISTYYATATQTWITASKSGDTVTVSLAKNTGSARSGYVYVHGNGDYGGSATASISVSQEKGTSSISVSPLTMKFDPSGQSLTATITMTNMSSYNVSESLGWLTTSKNGNYVTLTATGHTASTVPRNGTVYFYGTGTIDNTARTASIYISQNSNSLDVKIDGVTTKTMSDRPAAGEEFEFSTTLTNVSTSYVTASVNWLDPSLDGASNDLYVDVAPNSSYPRSGYVYLVGSNGTSSKTASLYVSQVSGISSISISPTSATAPVAGTSYKIPVTLTNASTYTVSESYDWISSSTTSTTATITVSQNTSTSARTGYVYFYATGTYDKTRRSAILTIRQPGATATDPTVRMYIDNLDDLVTGYYGSYGTDESFYLECDDTYATEGYELYEDLYYFDGSYANQIYGPKSEWLSFCTDMDGNSVSIGIPEYVIISGYYTDWDAIADAVVDAASGNGSFNITWPGLGPIISPTSLSYTSSGGGQYIYASGGYITSISSKPSWISTSALGSSATSCLLTASANTSTSSRSGTVTGYISGVQFSVSVYQSGASAPTTKSCKFQVIENGWMDTWDQSFDLQLSMTIGSTTICSYKGFNNGYDFNGVGDKTTSLGTYTVSSGNYLKIWASVNTYQGGTYKVVVESSGTVLSSGDLNDLDASSSSPALNASIYSYLSSNDTVTLYLEADESSGGSSSSGTTSVNTGGWSSVSSPISGYNAFQSSSNYNTGNGLAKCRVYVSGKAGSFTLYINNHSEARFDYTVAGYLDTALSATASSITNSSGQGSSYGITAGLATSLSGWTGVTYNIPNTSQHWIDVAYRKDSSVNSGNDRGYLLVPTSW